MLQPSQVYQNSNQWFITSPMSVLKSCVRSRQSHLRCTQGRPLLHEAKPSYIFSILKPHGQSSRSPVRLPPPEAKLSYVYLILKPHGQISKSPVRLLSHEAKPSYVYKILKNVTSPDWSQAVVCVSIPSMYPRSGYYLVSNNP